MPLTVLGDDDVRLLLHSLDRDDIISLQQSLGDALHYYSAVDAETDNECAAGQQLARTQMIRKDGSTTLFMPGSSTDGIGIKVVTLTESSDKTSYPTTLESTAASMSSLSLSNPSSDSSQTGSSDIPPYPSYSSSTAGSTSQLSSHTTPTSMSSNVPVSEAGTLPSTTSPSGTLTLLDRHGTARGFLNAAELTAFRTALASTMIFNKRNNVHDVVIFGAGKQAYWHARLALILRGAEIHHLNVINRSFDRSSQLMKSLFKSNWPVSVPHPKTEIITPGHAEYARHLKNLVRSASVIFFTTPSMTPLFPAEILTHTEGRKKGRYLAAIGSYKPHMCEIHPDIIRQAVAPTHHHHHHRHAQQGGAVVVDSVEACLREAGELIQAGVGSREVVELGELIMLKRDTERRRQERHDSSASSESDGVFMGHVTRKKGKQAEQEDDGGLKDWLVRGNVIYKSVGLALMVSHCMPLWWT
jgi:ornithine cyclodeaminase/alanine dehydrogenase-like protein (mu-crystallin family)